MRQDSPMMPRAFRRWTILVHRYLGIALGPLFVIWFTSGIAMIYAGGMPSLAADQRLRRLPPLDLRRVRLSPLEAAARAGRSSDAEHVFLLTIAGRPAYRFAGGKPITVFADTGEILGPVGQAESLAIAGQFMNMPASGLRHDGVLDRADQWTIGQRRQLPLHRIVAGDAAHTELYVSASLGEVVMWTTRGSRSLAWIAAIPHWLYLTPLRVRDRLWTNVVLWTSGLGTVAVLGGLILAVTQYRVRYSGLMRWHYVSGVTFGIVALTWVFSGWLSMEPGRWADSRAPSIDVARALSGGPLNLARFPSFDLDAWDRLLSGRPIKELELCWLQGEPYYVVHGEAPAAVVAAQPLRVRADAFPLESILDRLTQASAGAGIVDSQLLAAYDNYYYDRKRSDPLPVLLVKFDDPDRTWVYVDPRSSRVVAQVSRRQRLQRWIYHGFHSLDFSFWYYNRPLWDVVVIVLCSGGALLSTIGVIIGVRRLARSM
jgi:hypothetical protein